MLDRPRDVAVVHKVYSDCLLGGAMLAACGASRGAGSTLDSYPRFAHIQECCTEPSADLHPRIVLHCAV